MPPEGKDKTVISARSSLSQNETKHSEVTQGLYYKFILGLTKWGGVMGFVPRSHRSSLVKQPEQQMGKLKPWDLTFPTQETMADLNVCHLTDTKGLRQHRAVTLDFPRFCVSMWKSSVVFCHS